MDDILQMYQIRAAQPVMQLLLSHPSAFPLPLKNSPLQIRILIAGCLLPDLFAGRVGDGQLRVKLHLLQSCEYCRREAHRLDGNFGTNSHAERSVLPF